MCPNLDTIVSRNWLEMKKEKKELDVNSMGCCVPLTGMAEAVIRAQEGAKEQREKTVK